MKHRNQRYQRRQVTLVDKENNLNIIRHIVGIVDFQNCPKHILHIHVYDVEKKRLKAQMHASYGKFFLSILKFLEIFFQRLVLLGSTSVIHVRLCQ